MHLTVQLRRFLIVGSTTVLVDFASYSGCLALGLWIDLAKAVGFVIGTAFAYLANRLWTFEAGGGPGRIPHFLAVYLSTLVVNVAANAVVVRALPEGKPAIVAAFVVATGISASLNFLGMKFIVFRR